MKSEKETNIVMSKIIVAGGRDFDDYELLKSTLDTYISQQEVEIISGGARGADRLGELYARNNGYKLTIIEAKWDLHGHSAGYKRNVEMSLIATDVIVFWNGASKGSKHMIDIANKRGLKVKVVNY